MSEYEIKKAMPMPKAHRNRLSERFPFGDLAEGDCIEVAVGLRKTVTNHAHKFRLKNPGFKFNGRTIGEKFCMWCTKRPGPPPVKPVGLAAPPKAAKVPDDAVSSVTARLRDISKQTPTGSRMVLRK